jgi:hypothetical protein
MPRRSTGPCVLSSRTTSAWARHAATNGVVISLYVASWRAVGGGSHHAAFVASSREL